MWGYRNGPYIRYRCIIARVILIYSKTYCILFHAAMQHALMYVAPMLMVNGMVRAAAWFLKVARMRYIYVYTVHSQIAHDIPDR